MLTDAAATCCLFQPAYPSTIRLHALSLFKKKFKDQLSFLLLFLSFPLPRTSAQLARRVIPVASATPVIPTTTANKRALINSNSNSASRVSSHLTSTCNKKKNNYNSKPQANEDERLRLAAIGPRHRHHANNKPLRRRNDVVAVLCRPVTVTAKAEMELQEPLLAHRRGCLERCMRWCADCPNHNHYRPVSSTQSPTYTSTYIFTCISHVTYTHPNPSPPTSLSTQSNPVHRPQS